MVIGDAVSADAIERRILNGCEKKSKLPRSGPQRNDFPGWFLLQQKKI